MSALLQVIGREMRVRALMPVTGIATAATILLAGWLVAGGRRFAEVAESSVYFAGFFLVAGGLLMGALLLARDLEGNRSLFWLARPIGAWTAFLGKTIAALLLALVTTALVALPAIVVDPGLLEEPLVFTGAAGFAVACVALGGSLGLLLRNRSAWFLPAVAVLIGYGAGMWMSAEPILLSGVGRVDGLITLAVSGFIVALILAHGVAFARGRHDLRAQARIFTILLALILGGMLAAAAAFGAWLTNMDLGDFESLWVRGGSGNAVVVEGYRPPVIVPWTRAFAVDLAHATSVPLAPGSWDVAASPRRIFYAAPASIDRRTYEIMAVDLGASPRARTTGVTLRQQIGRMAASADGSRFAVSGPDGTRVFDLNGTSAGSFRGLRKPPEAWRDGWTAPFFPDRDRLRLYERTERGVVIREADLRSKTIRDLGTLPGMIMGYVPWLDVALVRGDEASPGAAPAISVRNGRTGAAIFDFPPGTRSAIPLADGRWAAVSRDENSRDESRLFVLTPRGAVLASFPLAGTAARIEGEVRPGIVTVGTADRGKRSLLLVETSSGRVVRTIADVGSRWWFGAVFPAPGSAEARLFTRGGELYLIDPATLEGKRVALR